MILCGKSEFTGVINSSILRWEDYPDNYQERSSVATWEARGSESEGDVLTEAEIKSYVAGSQGMQAASGNWKRQELDSFLEPPFSSLF